MKRSYSYFIVKPDGIRYLDEILEDLEGKFQEIKYYAADDFESLIKKLYHRAISLGKLHLCYQYTYILITQL